MASRSVIVRLEAEVAGFVAGMGRAGRATDDVARQVVQARRSVDENTAAMEKAGKVMLGFGTLTVAGLGASAKAAMDWETAWAGVTKTVNGTPQEMDALEVSLRNLAKTLPATHEEIAGVAEAAGQLGVARQDVVGFTKTMIDLAVSTNLTADEAATQIAQISNVMGTMAREGAQGVSRFGAALVALGNDGASTESEILAMTQRIAGAGATVGATETDVLALSNTLASMGIKAELGGGVTTRVLLKMFSAVKEGGGELDAFAKAAGTSAADFAKAYGESPVRAMDLVNKGLNRINEEGGNVVSTMKDMGIKGTEEVQVMLALANSGDLLSDSLDLGAKAWAENSALTQEAGKRYETTESKVKIAWNNIKDAAIDAGAVLLPVIQGIAESVSGLAQTFGNLPEPVQAVVVGFAGIVGGAALLGGGLLTLTTKFMETRSSIRALNTAGSAVPGTLGKVGKAAGIAAAAMIGMQVANAIFTQKKTVEAEAYAQALTKVANAAKSAAGQDGKGLDSVFSGYDVQFGIAISDIDSMSEAVKRLNNQDDADGIMKAWEPLTSFLGFAKPEILAVEDRFKELGNTMGQMASSGDTETAAEGFRVLTNEFQKNGKGAREALESVPGYKSALMELATSAGVAMTDQELLNFAMGKAPAAMQVASAGTEIIKTSLEETGVVLGGVIGDMDKFLEQLFAAGLITMSARDANAAYNEALRGVPETMKQIAESGGKMGAVLNEAKDDFDTSTEAGALANAAFQDIARKGMAEVEAKAKEGVGQDELQAKLTQTSTDLKQAGIDMGLGADAAEALARKVLGVPDGISVTTWIEQTASAQADALRQQLDALNGKRISMHIDTYRTTFEKTVGLPAQVSDGSYGQGLGVYAPPKAAGGDLDMAPGPKGVDSQLFFGAKGEHVLTTADVDAMGGQQAVYQFRKQLHAGNIQGLAGGGGVGTPTSARALVSSSPTRGGHATAQGIDYAALAAAVGDRPIHNEINMDGRKLYGWIRTAPDRYRDR